MKILNFCSLILFCSLLLSCTKEKPKKLNSLQKTSNYKVIHSSNKPLDKNFTYKIEKLFSINNENSEEFYITLPLAFDVDFQGNIFILDSEKATVFKFDKNGKFLKQFGRKGEGPGETIEPSFFCIINDTLYYGGAKTQNVIVCDNEGNFIKKIELPIRNGSPEFAINFDKDKVVSQIFSFEKSKRKIRIRVGVFDNKFQVENLLSDVSFSVGSILNVLTPFTCSDDKIYVARNSENNYIIDIYNLDGQLEATIQKDYRRIEYKDIDFGKKIKVKLFKKSIVGMFYDKKRDLLFVKRTFERNENNNGKFLVDVFKNNKFINTVELDVGKSRDFLNPLLQVKIVNDRLYVKNQELSVYKIENN